MTPPPPDQPLEGHTPGDTAPRWHAPPRPRSVIEPLVPPPPAAPEIPPSPDAPPTRGLLDRLGAPLLTLLLLLLVGAAAWPVVRDASVGPAPAPVIAPAPVATALAIYRPVQLATVGCFPNLALAETTGNPAIGRDEAEWRFREGYDFPLRASRLATLSDARLVKVGPGDPRRRFTGTPVATPAPTRLAWLLTFGRTTPLAAPLPARRYPEQEIAEFAYALLDAADGATIAACDGVGGEARADEFTLPQAPRERELRRPVAEAWAAGPPGGRVASWLPFTAAASFGAAITLPGDRRELVVDYYAAGEGLAGGRVQIVSTPRPPLLRLGADGGEPLTLADGHAARLDRMGEMTALTWQDGDRWYQIVAVRPQQFGPPFSPDELLRIAAGLRSREGD